MEAQQCVKLTGTNRSIGLNPPPGFQRTEVRDQGSDKHLILAIPHPIHPGTEKDTQYQDQKSRKPEDRPLLIPDTCPLIPDFCLDDLVAMARGQTPDPIPNSAVKTLSADGTAS